MDLNSRMNLDFKKIVIFIGVILLCLVISICFYISSRSIEEPEEIETPKRELVVDSEPIDVEIEPEVQDKTVGQLIARILNIRDLGTRIEYDIEVGLGENVTKSIVKATINTVFFDLNEKSSINPSDLQVGDSLVLYATGKYTVGNLEAEVIGLGSDTSYTYGTLSGVNTYLDGYMWTLGDGMNKLYITNECVVIEGYSGEPLLNNGIMQINDKILYKGQMIQSDLGNVFNCTEVIVFGS